MVEVYAFKMLDANCFLKYKEQLLAGLPDESRKKILSYTHPNAAQQTLIGEQLVRKILSTKTGIHPQDLVIQNNDHGKPGLSYPEGYFFNISHSGEWVVAAFSGKPVGIDVQKIRNTKMDVATRFFSPTEINDLVNKSASDQQDYFYTLWALKESYLKAIGTGLTQPLNSFTVIPSTRDKNDGFVLFQASEKIDMFINLLPFSDNYKLAVCSADPFLQKEIIYVDSNQWITGN